MLLRSHPAFCRVRAQLSPPGGCDPMVTLTRVPTRHPSFPWRRLRGILAEAQLRYPDLAEASGLHLNTVQYILTGDRVPGELARVKLARGLRKLGLEVPFHIEQ